MNPASGGIFYFTEDPKKARFLKDLKENKNTPKGSFKLCRVPSRGSQQVISESNQSPRLSATLPSKAKLYTHLLYLVPAERKRSLSR